MGGICSMIVTFPGYFPTFLSLYQETFCFIFASVKRFHVYRRSSVFIYLFIYFLFYFPWNNLVHSVHLESRIPCKPVLMGARSAFVPLQTTLPSCKESEWIQNSIFRYRFIYFQRQPLHILFDFTAADVTWRVTVAKSLPVLYHITIFPLGIIEHVESRVRPKLC